MFSLLQSIVCPANESNYVISNHAVISVKESENLVIMMTFEMNCKIIYLDYKQNLFIYNFLLKILYTYIYTYSFFLIFQLSKSIWQR